MTAIDRVGYPTSVSLVYQQPHARSARAARAPGSPLTGLFQAVHPITGQPYCTSHKKQEQRARLNSPLFHVRVIVDPSKIVEGVIDYPDGNRYEGQIYDGMRHGEGTLYDKNGQIIFKGRFEEGRMQGQGV